MSDLFNVEKWGVRVNVACQLREDSAIPLDDLLIADARPLRTRGWLRPHPWG